MDLPPVNRDRGETGPVTTPVVSTGPAPALAPLETPEATPATGDFLGLLLMVLDIGTAAPNSHGPANADADSASATTPSPAAAASVNVAAAALSAVAPALTDSSTPLTSAPLLVGDATALSSGPALTSGAPVATRASSVPASVEPAPAGTAPEAALTVSDVRTGDPLASPHTGGRVRARVNPRPIVDRSADRGTPPQATATTNPAPEVDADSPTDAPADEPQSDGDTAVTRRTTRTLAEPGLDAGLVALIAGAPQATEGKVTIEPDVAAVPSDVDEAGHSVVVATDRGPATTGPFERVPDTGPSRGVIGMTRSERTAARGVAERAAPPQTTPADTTDTINGTATVEKTSEATDPTADATRPTSPVKTAPLTANVAATHGPATRRGGPTTGDVATPNTRDGRGVIGMTRGVIGMTRADGTDSAPATSAPGTTLAGGDATSSGSGAFAGDARPGFASRTGRDDRAEVTGIGDSFSGVTRPAGLEHVAQGVVAAPADVAAAGTDAAHDALPVLGPRAVPEIAESVRRIVTDGAGHMDVELDPPTLGSVRISADVRGAEIGLTITAERPETRALLLSAIPDLQAALGLRGITASSIAVAAHFDPPADRQAPARRESGRQAQTNHDRRRFAAELRALRTVDLRV
jgi:Flagellar hook-length control protein FliK